jgi:Na+:H+ antiporter, NhaA family
VTTVARLLKPPEEFLRIETVSGLLLLVSAGVALAMANSGLHADFAALWDAPRLPGQVSLHFLVNDVLMAVFFLVVGLEIRREMHDGALSTLSQAALPLVAAAGGIVAPAIVYLLLAGATAQVGWAIPTATDIAFAVGVLALLGRRVYPSLRVLLLAVAIADDIAAVLIIALFYAEGIAPSGLVIAAAGAGLAMLGHRLGLNPWLATLLPGVLLWYGLEHAGIHPALAGVAVGMLVPMKPHRAGDGPPALRLESVLHPWVAFGVMPLFALANAGVRIEGIDFAASEAHGLALGIALGLAVGKPLGIAAAVAAAIRSRLVTMPEGVSPAGIVVIGCLAGIGFTMSIFIAAIAFTEPASLAIAKLGVLAGSAIAAVAGIALGTLLLRSPHASR